MSDKKIHSYYDAEAKLESERQAEKLSQETGNPYISGYDSFAGWTYREYFGGKCQGDYELTEREYYIPKEKQK